MSANLRVPNPPLAAWPPSATRVLISLSAGLFLWQWSLLWVAPSYWRENGVLSLDAVRAGLFDLDRPGPVETIGALSLAGLQAGRWWQPITHLFLHGGLVQLALGMIVLAAAGPALERIIGRRHLVGVYLLGGVAGGALQLAVEKNIHILGSVTAVCAVAIAATTILPEQDLRIFPLLRRMPLAFPAKIFAAGLMFTLVLLFFVDNGPAVSARRLQTAHLAPLAGCFVGWLYARVLGFGRRVPVYAYSRPVPALAAPHRPHDPEPEDAPADSADPHDFIRDAIDPILEKISREGLDRLTPDERRLLEQASERLPDSRVSKQ